MNNNFVKYQDLLKINKLNKYTNKECFVSIPKNGNRVIGKYVTSLNELNYSDKIMIRSKVYKKLLKADQILKKINANYQLLVVYGYRSYENQQKYFNREIKKVKNKFISKLDLYEYVHEKVAVPSVAGHPTGGAVDVVIINNETNTIIDFGTKVHDFEEQKSYISYKNISNIAYKNRLLLRKVMVNVGFAPYDGEWWHFSYGDKEWAFYYNKNKYLYSYISKDKVYKEGASDDNTSK